MTSKKESDEILGSREERKYQVRFSVLPTFPEKTIEGKKPVLRTGTEPVREKPTTAIRVRISELRKLLPWYFYKINRLRPLEERRRSSEMQKKAQLGTWLHQIDNLYRSIIHGYVGENTPLSFPSMKPEERTPYEHALRDIALTDDAKQEEIAQTLKDAYKIFRGQPGLVQPSTRSLPGFDAEEPSVVIQTIFSDEAQWRAELLAEAWARQVANNESGLWLFNRDARSEGEVRMILNFIDDIGIQFSGKMDSISWLPTGHERVVTQVGDLKTGWPSKQNEIEEEVRQLEAWAILTMAERYTVSKLWWSEEDKRPEKTYVPRSTLIDIKKFHGRSRMDYRVLQKGEREFTFHHFGYTKDERSRNIDLLKDLGQVIHGNETEARKILGTDIQFDLWKARLRPE